VKTHKDIFYAFEHTRLRLKERYGLTLTSEEYVSLCAFVKSLAGFWEWNGTDSQKITKMSFKNKIVTFVWSEERQCVTTALPNR